MLMSRECVFAELGVAEDWYRLHHDEEYAVALSRRYNDRAEAVVGRRLLSEKLSDPARRWPPIKQLHDISRPGTSGSRSPTGCSRRPPPRRTRGASGPRRPPSCGAARVHAATGLGGAKHRILDAGGAVPLYRSQRGPVTFATSVYGVENLIYLLWDQPDLAARFRDAILRAMLARAPSARRGGGVRAGRGAARVLLFRRQLCPAHPELYEFFGYPILKGVFGRYSPAPEHRRGQHSDSAMAHLLPLLGRLHLNTVNFGPTVRVDEIRQHLPHAVIHGQLAPFTLSRNEETNIVAEFLRDVDMARAQRGLVFATAGSINNGSRLTAMRLLMAAVQRYGRY